MLETPWLNPSLPYGVVTDIEGNTYATIWIGTQVWMAENLRTATYANGNPIPNVTDDTTWTQLNSGAWSHYANNPTNDSVYGKLYNWYAVADSVNICPTGWHVPTDTEWRDLSEHLGGADVAGVKMKTTSLWNAPNRGANNNAGFSGLPGGVRSSEGGNFALLGQWGLWWSASEKSVDYAWLYYLRNVNEEVRWNGYDKRYGFSVRCVRD